MKGRRNGARVGQGLKGKRDVAARVGLKGEGWRAEWLWYGYKQREPGVKF